MSTATLTERERRLPKWAQEELSMLRRDNERLAQAAEQARLATDPFGSDTYIDRHRDGEVGLGNGTPIGFRLDAGDATVRVKSDNRGVFLEVSTGWQGVYVEPWATNVVRFRMRED